MDEYDALLRRFSREYGVLESWQETLRRLDAHPGVALGRDFETTHAQLLRPRGPAAGAPGRARTCSGASGTGEGFDAALRALYARARPGRASSAFPYRAVALLAPSDRRPSLRGRGSPGLARLLAVEQAPVDAGVGVDAPVAQERPVRADLRRSAAGSPRRPGSPRGRPTPRRRTTPNGSARNELPQNSSPSPPSAATSCPTRLTARHVDAVGDRVRALDRLPRRALLRAVLGLLARVPADRRRVEEDGRAAQAPSAARPRGTTGPSRSARRCGRRSTSKALEAEVARREVELLVEERVVRDVHLAVEARDACRPRRGSTALLW